MELLTEPLQTETRQTPFTVSVNNQNYDINPLYDYELHGVVVSFHDADSFTDIWHHKRWKDFLNQRDLCVIWGNNVESGVYAAMRFSNDSWTCWASWQDAATGSLFQISALANNHLLVDNQSIKSVLMSAETGDHIYLKGMLVEYANKANQFHRGTSIVRTDTGNGACETIYLQEFAIVNKANVQLRKIYSFVKILTYLSLAATVILFFIVPYRSY
jgi:hypothetical protein